MEVGRQDIEGDTEIHLSTTSMPDGATSFFIKAGSSTVYTKGFMSPATFGKPVTLRYGSMATLYSVPPIASMVALKLEKWRVVVGELQSTLRGQ